MELERVQRRLADQISMSEDNKRRASQAEGYRKEMESLRVSVAASKSDFASREQELTGELQIIKQTKFLLVQEVESLKQKLDVQRRNLESCQADCSRGQHEIQEMRLEKERIRKELALQENSRADAQLHNLRRELEQTVGDWQLAEREKAAKDEGLMKVQRELSKEREKASLLKTQVALLDERLRVAYQELSVFRSLDVYHSTLHSELLHQRTTRSSPDKQAATPDRRLSMTASQDFAGSTVNSLDGVRAHNSGTGSSPSRRMSNFPTLATENEPNDRLLTLGEISGSSSVRNVGSSAVSQHYHTVPASSLPSEFDEEEVVEAGPMYDDDHNHDPDDMHSMLSEHSSIRASADHTLGGNNTSVSLEKEALSIGRRHHGSSRLSQSDHSASHTPASTTNSSVIQSNNSTSDRLNFNPSERGLFNAGTQPLSARQERELARQRAIRLQLSSSAPMRRATTASSITPHMQSHSNQQQQHHPTSRVAGSVSVAAGGGVGGNYNPLKADFDRARRLLAKSGAN